MPGKKKRQAGGRPAWRQIVLSAVQALGPSYTLAEVYAEVKRQWPVDRPWPPSASWQATVRRTLQELRDSGELTFEGGRKSRLSPPGTYHAPRPLPSKEVMDAIVARVSDGHEVLSSKFYQQENPFHHAWYEHVYECLLTEFDEEDEPILYGQEHVDIEAIASATMVTYQWYKRECAVNLQLLVELEEGTTYPQWINVAYADNPSIAAQQLDYNWDALREKGARGSSRYKLTDTLIHISIVLREPKEYEDERIKQALAKPHKQAKKRKSRAKRKKGN